MIEIYSRVLEFSNLEESQAKTWKGSEEGRKVKSSYNKMCNLRITSPAFLGLDWYRKLSVRCQAVWMTHASWSRGWVPGGLVRSYGLDINFRWMPDGLDV